MLEDLFLGRDPLRRYDILAGAEAGAYSIAVGEGMWRSVAEKPIDIKRLFRCKMYNAEKEGPPWIMMVQWDGYCAFVNGS